MKKVLLLGLALLFVSSAVSAQQLALYIDEGRTEWCALDANGEYVYVYLFGYLAEGLQCVELSTISMVEPVEGEPYPVSSEIRAFAAEYPADIADPIMGTFPNEDFGACYNACYNDWVWLVKAEMNIRTALPVVMYIQPFQGTIPQPFPKILNCTGGEIQAFPLTNCYINGCGPVAVEESSWGAIKNMYE